ncbi:MAG: DUF6175 family protein [Bacteroidaceae bacterium]|nr:DUF6175 family protein [Bacteroidaceae bacterium]
MKIKKNTIFAAIAFMMLCSCGGNGDGKSLAEGASGDMEAYEGGDVNAIEQARPQIMVIPADQTLKNFSALKETTVDGKNFIVRDYKKYLLADDSFPRLASFIQDAFNNQNYPLTDFEQTLKQLETQAATDLADGLRQDAKTQLLQTAQPDIILEMNYYKSSSLTSHDYKNKNVSYTLTALDAYTNKSIATVTTSNIKGESTTETIQNDLKEKLPSLMNDIQKYFSDILTRGREVTVRIVVDGESNVNLQDQSIEGDTYSDWFMDFIKAKSVKGACKMQRNSNNELYFVNVRIPLLQDDGTQYGVYDFTRELQKNLRKNLGLQSTNNSQGLGEVILTVKGI